MQDKQDIVHALYKKALGYEARESVEEYTAADDELVLSKKKVTNKHYPPDITALKLLLSMQEEDVSGMTDEQLEAEKQRLLRLLEKLSADGESENGGEQTEENIP